jgi:hypothetical protein
MGPGNVFFSVRRLLELPLINTRDRYFELELGSTLRLGA